MNVVSKLFCVQVVYLCLGSLCSGMGLWVSFYYYFFLKAVYFHSGGLSVFRLFILNSVFVLSPFSFFR